MPKHYSTGMRRSPAQLNREIAEALATRPRTTCYACDDEAAGVRDRRHEGGSVEGGSVEGACARHADPTISHPREHQRGHSSISPGILHVIQGNYGYGHGWEDLTAETTREEALARLREYRENEPGTSFRRIRRRELGVKKPLLAADTKKSRQGPATKKPQARAKNVHAARSKLLLSRVQVARDPHAAKQHLKAAGVNFSSDFHQLPRRQVELILATAHAAEYRKRKDAPGSTARMYFQYLSRLR